MGEQSERSSVELSALLIAIYDVTANELSAMAPAIHRSLRSRSALFRTVQSQYSSQYWQQALLQHAKKMADLYPEDLKPTYQEAARTLRAPYWDWASSPSLPFAATAPTFMINTSAGPLNLRNPLFSYQFQKFPFTDSDFTSDLAQFNESKRCTLIDSSQGINSFDDSNWNLTSDGTDLKDEVVGASYIIFLPENGRRRTNDRFD